MRIAVLDLGTNTFLLLICDVESDGAVRPVFRSRKVVKLGEGGIGRKEIAPLPFQRGVQAMADFSKILKKYSVDHRLAFATSGIRSAKNRDHFIDAAQKASGIEIKVIAGREEARLIYTGVRECVELGEGPCLIMDIGGGSTEFIIANRKRIFWKRSFNVGVARLLAAFDISDPITGSESKKVRNYLEEALKPLEAAMRRFPVDTLVGSSGSFESYAQMIGFSMHGKDVSRSRTHYEFNLDEYRQLHERLLKSTLKQRKEMKGLLRMRVEMIVVASICSEYILQKYRIRRMLLSKYALREGALFDFLQRKPFGVSEVSKDLTN